MDGVKDIELQLEPSGAHFKFEPARETIQDLIKAVRAAGSEYDARLMLQSDFDDDKLSDALRKVEGVRAAGMADKRGIRLVTFFMDKKTFYGDLVNAANAIGAKIESPKFSK